mgnify:CR=1 FL=1
MAKTDYGTGYLYAEDLLVGGQFRTAPVTISEVVPPGTLRAANGKTIDKPVVRFEGKAKALCLCKTNASIIHIVTGETMGPGWVGKTITLQARTFPAFGEKNTLGIRVIPPVGTALRRKLAERLGAAAVWKSSQPQTSKPAAVAGDISDEEKAAIIAAEQEESNE